MNADEYLPNAETIAAIEKDVANYNERRRHAQGEIGRRVPMLLGSYVLACAVVFYFIIANFSSMPEKVALILLIGGGIAAIVPLHPKLFRLCNHRASPLWRSERRVVGNQANRAVPSLGRVRTRSSALIERKTPA